MSLNRHEQPALQDQPASHNLNDSIPGHAATPLQQAIRARALATLENDERQPKPTPRRKLWTAVMVVLTVTALLLLIDFSVRVMHHILMMWYPEPTQVQPPKPLGPNEPYYITVEPPAEESSAGSAK